MRGVVDRKGELFAYVEGNSLFTLEGELTGHIRDGFVFDLNGRRVWRAIGDGLYELDGIQEVGFIGSERPQDPYFD